ncbi:LysR substrate-binding domain-containing protein [Streptomyces sp. NPDC048623]|uniref:LysR family transcriptional regulator n=1 Tax=Streptomyces sp. NPDC048623 TaxID=3155761 RepID=UPI003427F516
MDHRQLEYFLAIVDHGGFHRAASALYVSQPTLSQAVRALERELGTALFHRIGRRVILTDAGTELIAPARAAVLSLEIAKGSVGAVRELRGGRLQVAAMASATVEPLGTMVRGFAERYPAVTLGLKVSLTAQEVVDAVRTGACELGLLITAGQVRGKDIIAREIGDQRLVLVTSADGPFPAGQVVCPRQLAGHRLITGQRGTAIRAYVDDLAAHGIDVTIAVETEHRMAFLPLVLKGVGLAVVTRSWADLARRAGAMVLDIEPAVALRNVLVSRKGELTSAARAFLDMSVTAAG